MEQISRSDEPDREETYGFHELYRALDVDTRQEIIQTEIAIYSRTEDVLDTDERPDIAGDLEKMEQAGAAVASEYAGYIDEMSANSELPENFDDMSVRQKLNEIESNTSVLNYLN